MKKKNRNVEKEENFKLPIKYEILILIALFFMAFIVRMLTYNSIFVGDNVRFLEFDPFYHMRRVISFAENFPYIWNFDTYLDFPYGNNVEWPPLYDWTIAFIAYILGVSHNIQKIETIGAYFPVFLGALSTLTIYFITKEIFDYKGNWKIASISGLIFSIIPGFVQVSFLGFTDHHVAEVFLSLLMFIFFLKAFKSKQIKYVLLTIFIVILAILTWEGAPIFIGIIFIYLIIQSIIDKKYLISISMVGIVTILYILSYFFFPSIFNTLNTGIGFLFKHTALLQQVRETQPLFFDIGSNQFTLGPAWYAFNTAFYITFAGMIFLIINIFYKKKDKDENKKNIEINKNKNEKDTRLIVNVEKEKIFFLLWTFIVLTLNLLQTRFVYLFAVNVAIICSYTINFLVDSNKVYIQITGIFLFLIILVPSVDTVTTMAEHPLMLTNDWFTSLQWLKDNTPSPYTKGYEGSWDLPVKDKIPDYGIMSWWDYGNYILYLSKRPVVANNFQLGAEDSAKFLTSESESEANSIMNKRKAKYVIVDYRVGLNLVRQNNQAFIRGTFGSVAFLANKDLRYYLDKNNMPNDNYFNTTYAKLYLFEGKGLNDYKLIYKSQTHYPDLFNKPIEEIKIFEYTGKMT